MSQLTFTGEQKPPGFWRGLAYRESDRVENTPIRNGAGYGLYTNSSSVTTSNLTHENNALGGHGTA